VCARHSNSEVTTLEQQFPTSPGDTTKEDILAVEEAPCRSPPPNLWQGGMRATGRARRKVETNATTDPTAADSTSLAVCHHHDRPLPGAAEKGECRLATSPGLSGAGLVFFARLCGCNHVLASGMSSESGLSSESSAYVSRISRSLRCTKFCWTLPFNATKTTPSPGIHPNM